MTQPARSSSRLRPWIAMAAAYALALQALLGSFALAQAAAAGPALPFVLCVDSASAPGPHTPADAALCNRCAICSGLQAVDLPVPQDRVAAPTVFAVAIWSGSKADDSPVRHGTPKLSQGPPHRV